MLKILAFVVMTMSFNASSAAGLPQELKDTLDLYRKSESMILEVRKTVKNSLLEKETIFKGMIKFVKGKFYWETSEPEKNLIIYDGKIIWTIQYPSPEFKDTALQVAKTKVKNKKNSPIILAEIFGTKPLDSVFVVTQKSKDGPIIIYDLKEKSTEFGLKNLSLKIDTNTHRVAAIQYIDEVENETKLEFRSTQFNIKIKPSIFKYMPPKNAQVTEY